jgi:hypothetical protein
MSGADALKVAHAAGIHIGIDGNDLVLEAMVPPHSALLDLLSRHKAGIVTLLRLAAEGWSAEDWQVFFDERAGIAEFDGGLSRDQAEAHAFACCAMEWLNRNPARSPPGRCLGCSCGDQVHDPVLPYDVEGIGDTWRCWPAWCAGRKAEAIAALATMGIAPPDDLPDDFGKKEACDGRLRIGRADHLGARHGGNLPLDQCESAAKDGLSSARLAGWLAVDTRRREGRLYHAARRG